MAILECKFLKIRMVSGHLDDFLKSCILLWGKFLPRKIDSTSYRCKNVSYFSDNLLFLVLVCALVYLKLNFLDTSASNVSDFNSNEFFTKFSTFITS